jgi:adenylosuccinate synthase
VVRRGGRRYAARINGLDSVALTKLDVLDAQRIQVCQATAAAAVLTNGRPT